MVRSVRSLPAALAAALTLVSCASPSRAADDVTQTRNVSGFDRIRVEGAFTAEVTAGHAATRVAVTGDRDRLDRVTTEVHDGTLVVGMRDGESWSGESPKIVVSLPALRAFTLAGAGSATLAGLNGGDVAIAVPGAGTVTASGHAGSETIALNGTGKIDARAVYARDVTVTNNGVGAVYVHGSGNLDLSVNGVGEIRYAGNPAHVASSVHGVGEIKAL